MNRAYETAEPLAAAKSIEIEVEPGVREFDHESSFYIPMEELKQLDPERWREMVAEFASLQEDLVKFRDGVIQTLERIVGENAGRRIAVVCHGGVINGFAGHVLGIPAPMFFEPDYTSINRFFAASSGERTLASLNETPHLAARVRDPRFGVTESGNAPFSGVRVVDFSRDLAGALASMLLADFGADVIDVVEPGERTRVDADTLCFGRNKRCVELDLGKAEDLANARALCATADVALFDRSSNELRALGLHADAFESENPALLHVSLSHYGEGSQFAHLPVDDTLLWGLSGAAFGQFAWEDVPVHLLIPLMRTGHGMMASVAIAAGLYERDQSGRGQTLRVNGLHALGALLTGATYLESQPPVRRGIGSRGAAPNYKLYECADGEWIFLATLMPHHFELAIQAMGIGDLLDMPGVDGLFANILKQGVGRHVRDRLERRFAERDRESWLETLHAAGVPCGPVGDRDDWFDSETVAANDLRVSIESDRDGRVEIPGVTVELSETPGSVRGLRAGIDLDTLLRERPAPAPLARGGDERQDSEASGSGPLAGVRAIDLGQIIAAPLAATILANLGADVIKVEPPSGDGFRRNGAIFVGTNAGKRAAVLDLKQTEQRDRFLELVRDVDVVIDNYRLGVLERLGIDHPALSKQNPRLISASVTAYGQRGPLSARPGFDPLLQAESGLMAAQGGDDEPVFHQIAVNDVTTAMMTAFGVIAALYARRSTHAGQRVTTSLAAQSVLVQGLALTRWPKRPQPESGGRDWPGPGPLRRFYACADGWIGISCTTNEQAAGLARALDLPQSAMDTEATGEIEERFRALPRSRALDALTAHAVPAAPVIRQDETLSAPLFRECEFFVVHQHPEFGEIRVARTFAEFSRTPAGYPRPAPLLAEDQQLVSGNPLK